MSVQPSRRVKRPVLIACVVAAGLAAAVLPADETPRPKTPPLRPYVKAELQGGVEVEGYLDYFDDGTYRIISGDKLRTFKESAIVDIDLVVPMRTKDGKHGDPQVALLVKQFRRPKRDPEGSRIGYDPSVIPKLAAQGERVIEPLIAEVAKDSDVYQAVGEVFLQLGPRANPALVEAVRNDSSSAASFPVWWAFKRQGVACTPLMQTLLKDKDPRIRKLAIDVLYSLATTSGNTLPKSLDESLITAFDDPLESVRNQAPLILGRVGFQSERTLPALLATLTTERHGRICSQSIIALGELGSELKEDDADLKKIVAALAKATTDDPTPLVRGYGCLYLGMMGPKAKSAIPAIRKATEDKKEIVRKYAEEALMKIGTSVKNRDPFGG